MKQHTLPARCRVRNSVPECHRIKEQSSDERTLSINATSIRHYNLAATLNTVSDITKEQRLSEISLVLRNSTRMVQS